MASFQLRRRDTGIIYNIKVAEFIFRNTYGTDAAGRVTSLEPTGFTSITALGDNIVQKLGEDALLQGAEFEFTNNPTYYLKGKSLGESSPNLRFKTPSAAAITDLPEYNIILKYVTTFLIIELYSINSSTPITTLFNINLTKVYNNATNEEMPVSLPFTPNSISCVYYPRLAFNFVQKQVGIVSPYYYKVQEFLYPNQTYNYNQERFRGNCTPVYYGTPYTLRNNVIVSSYYGLYDKNKTQVEGLVPSSIKKYSDISGKSYNISVSSSQNGISESTSMRLLNKGTILGQIPYDFYYSLLFDTTSDDNPYPDTENENGNNPSGQSPTNTGGNPSGGDKSSTDIGIPLIPTVTPISTGSVNLYEMDASTFRNFMQYLWSNPFYTAFIKLFENPMDAIISAHIIGVAIPTQGSGKITVGNVETTVMANIVQNNFVAANFNYIEIPEFYKDSSDYIDTVIELYIPYYGYVTLNTYEVMGAKIYLQYIIDVLTGSFVAFVKVEKTIDGTNLNSVLYQYNGNMAYQIPLSSIDYSSYITATLNALGALSQKRIGNMIGGLVDAALSVEMGYDRASTLTANTGYMSVKDAYVTILRPIHKQPPNFAKYVGFPYEGYINLGSCKGLTICREVYINNVIGTVEETEEIRRLLLEEVIF